MIRKFINTVIVFGFINLCLVSINAQSAGFTKEYYFDHRATLFQSVIEFNNDLLVVGESGLDSSGLASIFILRIDTNGVVKNLDFYKDPKLTDHLLLGRNNYNAITKSNDGGLVIFGSMFTRNNLYMIRLDSNLNLEYFIEYPSSYLFRGVTGLIELDSFYYILGNIQKVDLNVDIFIQKVNLDGNFVWEKTYGSVVNGDATLSAIDEDVGITVISNEWHDPNQITFNDENIWTNIYHIDTAGIIKWEWKSENREEGSIARGLIKINNLYYYLNTPQYQINIQSISRAAQIVCRHEDFSLKWRKTYTDTFHLNSFEDIILGSDGYLYTTGQIADEVTWAYVHKIDPEQGNIKWAARDTGIFIQGYGSRNVMEKIIQLSNGSLIAVGITLDAQIGHEHGLLLKVTKDGCIDTICTTSSIDEYSNKKTNNVVVYPNPTSDQINFKLNSNYSKCKLKVYDLQGVIHFFEDINPGVNTFSTTNMLSHSGLYFYQIYNDRGNMMDSGKFIILQN